MRRMEKTKYFAMGMVVMGAMASLVVPAVDKSTDNDYFAMSGRKRSSGFTLSDEGYSIVNLNG